MSFLSGRTSLTTVQTADLADNAITLAKMAHGTASQNIAYDGSGVPVDVAISAVETAGALYGLIISNDSSDVAKDLDITAGTSRNSTDAVTMTTGALVKRIDASWATGTGNGGLSSSLSASNDTWYHIFQIVVGGVADVGFDTSPVAANLVSDHTATAFRRIGSIEYETAAWQLFVQQDDMFKPDTITLIRSGSGITTQANVTMGVPTGVEVMAWVSLHYSHASNIFASVGHPDNTLASPTATASRHNNTSADEGPAVDYVPTNTSAQVSYRCSSTNNEQYIIGGGWLDHRGKSSPDVT